MKGTTVLDIGFSSGFNSKSAFNDVFRRSTGMTPSEFKKKSVQAAASESITPPQAAGYIVL